MKNRAYLLAVVPFTLLGLAFVLKTSQTPNSTLKTENVTVSDFQFSPAQLTINVGDSVQWHNEGGSHNVNADDGSFKSGDLSSDPWTYTFTFLTPGTYRYYCENHGGPGGFGMSGTITVVGEPPIFDHNLYLPLLLK